MTKKRLSDLLKEEVSKTEPSEAPLPSPDPAVASRRSLSRRRGSAATLQSATSATAPTDSSSLANPETETQVTAVATPTPDPRILELEKALVTAEAAKTTLEKTIKGLQSDLEIQQARLFELKDSLDKSQAELQEARQTIVKLTQGSTSAPTPTPKPRANRSGVDIVPRTTPSQPSQPGYVRGVPTQAPLGGQPNSMISDTDIGWVD